MTYRHTTAVPPRTLLTVANLTVPRKPDRGPATRPDPLASAAAASQALGFERLDTSELGALRALHAVVVQLVDGLLRGRDVARPLARLSALAQASTATVRLEAVHDPRKAARARLKWSEAAPAATLARRVAVELGEIEVARLKRCQRTGCDLVFYDATRSATQRWHADSPCGNRERQRRHRAARAGGRGASDGGRVDLP